jgi:hypothetical protein
MYLEPERWCGLISYFTHTLRLFFGRGGAIIKMRKKRRKKEESCE